jgi:hypothetical protein
MSLSKWETNKIVNPRCHSDPAVAGEESLDISAAGATQITSEMFRFAQHDRIDESETSGGQVRLSHEHCSISAIGRRRRIRRLICRLLAAGFRLGLVQRFFGFSMDCFGAFFCFLAYSLSGFLGLSTDGFRGLLGLFSDCFSSFFGFFARSFDSVFNRLPCFFGSVFCIFQRSFLPERRHRHSRSQRNYKARNSHDCFLFIRFPIQKKRMARPHRAHRAA